MTLTASLLDVDKSSSAMAAPRTIEDTGLAIDQIEQLLTKTLFGGELSGHSIAERMRCCRFLASRPRTMPGSK